MSRALVGVAGEGTGRLRLSDDQLRSIVRSGAIVRVSAQSPVERLRSSMRALRRVVVASEAPDHPA